MHSTCSVTGQQRHAARFARSACTRSKTMPASVRVLINAQRPTAHAISRRPRKSAMPCRKSPTRERRPSSMPTAMTPIPTPWPARGADHLHAPRRRYEDAGRWAGSDVCQGACSTRWAHGGLRADRRVQGVADEEYTCTGADDELRGELNKLTDSLYKEIVSGISTAWHLPRNTSCRKPSTSAIMTGQESKDRGLVDVLVDQDGLRPPCWTKGPRRRAGTGRRLSWASPKPRPGRSFQPVCPVLAIDQTRAGVRRAGRRVISMPRA